MLVAQEMPAARVPLLAHTAAMTHNGDAVCHDAPHGAVLSRCVVVHTACAWVGVVVLIPPVVQDQCW
jgi:hypothetical protein